MPTYLPLAICVAEKAMHEFCKQWLAGLQPFLSLETAPNGEIRVFSKVTAGDVVIPDHRDARHGVSGQTEKRRRGPSYYRRLQRRATARKVAAAQQIADKAIPVEVVAPDVPTVDVPDLPLVGAVHVVPPPPLIQDELCPDKDYLLPTIQDQQQHLAPQHHLDVNIPQLDGHGSDVMEHHQHEDLDEWINPNPVTGLWVCRCCTYAHCFPTEDDLKQHHDNLIFEYEECNICYTWHVWT